MCDVSRVAGLSVACETRLCWSCVNPEVRVQHLKHGGASETVGSWAARNCLPDPFWLSLEQFNVRYHHKQLFLSKVGGERTARNLQKQVNVTDLQFTFTYLPNGNWSLLVFAHAERCEAHSLKILRNLRASTCTFPCNLGMGRTIRVVHGNVLFVFCEKLGKGTCWHQCPLDHHPWTLLQLWD